MGVMVIGKVGEEGFKKGIVFGKIGDAKVWIYHTNTGLSSAVLNKNKGEIDENCYQRQ